MRKTHIILILVLCVSMFFTACESEEPTETEAYDGVIEAPVEHLAMIKVTNGETIDENTWEVSSPIVWFSFVGDPGAECVVSAEEGYMLAPQGWHQMITSSGFHYDAPNYRETSIGKVSAGSTFGWSTDDYSVSTYMRAVFYIDGEIAGFAVAELTTGKIDDEYDKGMDDATRESRSTVGKLDGEYGGVTDDVTREDKSTVSSILKTKVRVLYQCVFSETSGKNGDAVEYIGSRTAELIGREWHGVAIPEDISDIVYSKDGNERAEPDVWEIE